MADLFSKKQHQAPFSKVPTRGDWEMYPRGSRDRTRNAAARVTGAWVRIPPSPPQENTCEVALAGVFVFFERF